ncbi:MAG: phosphatidylserine/phosphatidylglycerophosphate/cardiolipin synthase family protein [Candidatus Marinimicrobia bacterium]|jgi:sugar-specific transcriptional regulator TrmB|nr:phosphatidylserine/phosphatidylglycerophosphate/cardiolipin synthase family protein [Candidatus Neomarinimicrobiota bacterium]MBT3675658.1 phosphatidylserine/phosphatidylglycerophosphate/cardiolipin synthase family protein [Candidatus Neomarinimicrobiota bacterium]MBT3763383.1 phosphatidylserine/phosphatidylglycerophosphate/cardiolipin synthase family protein [Candidatus Neomarinimicrobiota bacterium]MBT4068063.1 phosphatidylserine/phosphatidylglycerophosphate/cardiolipin synthase family prot
MKTSKKLRIIKNIIKKIIFNRLSFSIYFVIIIEFYYYSNQHLEFELGNILFFIVFFLLTVGFVSWLKNSFATNEILLDEEIKSKVSDIISYAEEFIVIVSPFFSPGETLLRNIIQAAKNEVKVYIVHNTKELENPEFLKILKRIDGICKVYNHPNLHSKLYFNESEMIITSLNLNQSSMMNSFEVGWHSNKDMDFERVKGYVHEGIINDKLSSKTEISKVEEKLGYCIRTKKRILLNIDRPIEIGEYYKSNRSNDGSYCHKCGDEFDTSIDNPFCKNHQSLLKI